jgi:ABC-type thiamin/hydroxymethylpyrimidine transport system permease subunit
MNLASYLVFEVMDKEWPLWLVLVFFLGLGFSGIFICRKWPLASVLVLALTSLGAVRVVAELNDPYVAGAIRAEAGLPYFVLTYSAIGVSVLLTLAGTWLGSRRRKSNSGTS